MAAQLRRTGELRPTFLTETEIASHRRQQELWSWHEALVDAVTLIDELLEGKASWSREDAVRIKRIRALTICKSSRPQRESGG